MSARLKETKENLVKVLTEAKVIVDAVEAESREFTAEERAKVGKMMEDAGKIKKQIKDLEGDAEMVRQMAELGIGLTEGRSDGFKAGMPAGAGGSLGEQFVKAAGYQDWMKAMNGRIPDGMSGLHSPPVQFDTLLPGRWGRKTLVTGASETSAGAFVNPDITGIYEALGRRERTVLGLITIGQTGSDTVQFVRQTAQVTQATTVAEATATSGASGTKPEGAMAFEVVTETVKTIAVWVPTTKRAVSDVAQLRSLIDSELSEDLEEHLEDQLIAGDGDGENFTGVLETSGILTQTWDTDILTTTRKAKTALMTTGRTRRPTAWVMNPSDWETIELLQDGNDRYYYGGPISNGEPRLWGVPIVENEAMTAGTAVLADWRKAKLWRREQANISISDSHSDFFIRNMLAVLGEERAAFGLIRPSAFISVALTAGS